MLIAIRKRKEEKKGRKTHQANKSHRNQGREYPPFPDTHKHSIQQQGHSLSIEGRFLRQLLFLESLTRTKDMKEEKEEKEEKKNL